MGQAILVEARLFKLRAQPGEVDVAMQKILTFILAAVFLMELNGVALAAEEKKDGEWVDEDKDVVYEDSFVEEELKEMDKDGDGQASKEEVLLRMQGTVGEDDADTSDIVKKMLDKKFSTADADGNGKLNVAELKTLMSIFGEDEEEL